MARTRTISQNIALLAGGVDATGNHGTDLYQIYRLQSLDYSWANPKQDVQAYGLAAPISRETVESPEVNLNFSFLVNGVDAFYDTGFQIDDGSISFLADILDESRSNKNYFIFVAPDGQDASGLDGTDITTGSGGGIIGIGNGVVNSISIEGSVGNFVTSSLSVQGLNLKSYTSGVVCPIPAVNPTTGLEMALTNPSLTFSVPSVSEQSTITAPSVIRPGDISLSLASAGGLFHDYVTPCVQSFNISFDLNRQPINCLGSRFAASRSIQFPINVNFEVELIAKDIATGSLANFLCQTGTYSATLSLKEPSCNGDGAEAVGIRLQNISLEGQQWSSSVGGEPQSLRLSWVGQVGGATDINNGLFVSGLTH